MTKKDKAANHKSLDYYLSLPYRLFVYRDEANEGPYWASEVVELPGCAGDGDTPEAAIESLRQHMRVWLEEALQRGIMIPEPGHAGEYSGKFMVRVPKVLHHNLARRAEREGVSLNAWVSSVLAWHGA